MIEPLEAKASPEKRLFISLITRDISLIDAFLDVIDNSVNAALEPFASKLKTAQDYQRLLLDKKIKPKVKIEITIDPKKITISDNASGISAAVAQDHVFKFGRPEGEHELSDRLSVYGIGLKRAIFKCGNKIRIESDHKNGGFRLDLDVKKWAKLRDEPWTFQISSREPVRAKSTRTQVEISELYPDVLTRLADGMFLKQLKEKIARTYSFFLGRIVEISVDGESVPGEAFEIGGNFNSESFKLGRVSCTVTAGIVVAKGDTFRNRNSGWFVFCNGRTVLFADKTTLTGWGSTLPIFQPKHRPFVGTVFFVSENPEDLPWNTTKSSVNVESIPWQTATRHMTNVGRVLTSFLDKRYTEDGTEVPPSELQELSGGRTSVFEAATSKSRAFQPPKKKGPTELRIQYSVKLHDVKRIEEYLQQPGMGGSAVGRYTFDYFLKNEVDG